jgi:hypothetical protein
MVTWRVQVTLPQTKIYYLYNGRALGHMGTLRVQVTLPQTKFYYLYYGLAHGHIASSSHIATDIILLSL